jgi:hypothetical protein
MGVTYLGYVLDQRPQLLITRRLTTEIECLAFQFPPRKRGEEWLQDVRSVHYQIFLRMRSSLPVRASDCTSCNGPGFDPSISRHSGICVAADEAVLNKYEKKIKKSPQQILERKKKGFF